MAATKSPTIKELGWAAGFLEGEGWFGAQRGTARISGTQVNREPLEHLLQMFGGTIYFASQKSKKIPNARDQWQWAAFGGRARGIMMTLYPLMSTVRKSQIRHALGVADAVNVAS